MINFYLIAITLAGSLIQASRVESGSTFTISLRAQTVHGIEGPYRMPGDQYINYINLDQYSRQKLKIQFDNSYNGLFVPLKKQQEGNLHFKHGFNPLNSVIVREDVLEYKNSSLIGKYAFDDIFLDDKQMDLKLKSIFFIADDSSRDFSSHAWDGIFGLGPKYSVNNTVKNLILSLKQQGIIAKAQFGLWFSPPMMREQKLEIVLGDLDVKRASDMSIISGSFKDKENWRVHLSSVWINNQPIGCQFQNCKALFNSGSSATYGPADQVYQLYRELGIDANKTSNTYVDCDTVPRNINLKFVFEARERTFPSAHFIKDSLDERNNKRICYVTIYPHDREQLWSMGTNFMSAYYTAYDVENEQFMIAH